MERYAIITHFFVESEEDPEDIATEFDQGFSGLGGPILDAARQFPGGEVMGGEVSSIRPATEDEISSHFEE